MKNKYPRYFTLLENNRLHNVVFYKVESSLHTFSFHNGKWTRLPHDKESYIVLSDHKRFKEIQASELAFLL